MSLSSRPKVHGHTDRGDAELVTIKIVSTSNAWEKQNGPTFQARRNLLRRSSGFFHRLLGPQTWPSKEDPSIPLLGVHVDVFRIFTDWLSRADEHDSDRGELFPCDIPLLKRECRSCHHSLSDWRDSFLLDLYTFSKDYETWPFTARVIQTIKRFYQRQQKLPSSEMMERVSSGLRPNHPIRLALSAMWIRALRKHSLKRGKLKRHRHNYKWVQEILSWAEGLSLVRGGKVADTTYVEGVELPEVVRALEDALEWCARPLWSEECGCEVRCSEQLEWT